MGSKHPDFPISTGAVTSPDGTSIGYRKLGSGPGLVLVHGTGSYGAIQMPFAQYLAQSLTVYVVDRRGRGLSGPQRDAHCLEREYEDTQAMLEHTGSTMLYGHSYGGVVALGTALRTRLDKLVVYEPALLVSELAKALEPAFSNAVATGKYAKSQRIWLTRTGFYPASMGWPIHFVYRYLKPRTSTWPTEVEAIKATVAEDECLETQPDVAAYSEIAADTLVIVGEKAIPELKASCDAVTRVLPGSERIELKGQGHEANSKTPGHLASIVTRFLLSDSKDSTRVARHEDGTT